MKTPYDFEKLTFEFTYVNSAVKLLRENFNFL